MKGLVVLLIALFVIGFSSCPGTINGPEPIEDPYMIDWSFLITDGVGKAGYFYENELFLWNLVKKDSVKFTAPLYSRVFFYLEFNIQEHPGSHYVIMSNLQAGPYPDRWIAKWREGGIDQEKELRPGEWELVYPDPEEPFYLGFQHHGAADIEFTEIKIYVIFVQGKIRHISITNRYN